MEKTSGIEIQSIPLPMPDTSGNYVLTGTQTSELIKGLSGNNLISGMKDRADCRSGWQRHAESGADSGTFVINLSNLTIADLITDYDSSGAMLNGWM